jgi:hypothetical protein
MPNAVCNLKSYFDDVVHGESHREWPTIVPRNVVSVLTPPQRRQFEINPRIDPSHRTSNNPDFVSGKRDPQ